MESCSSGYQGVACSRDEPKGGRQVSDVNSSTAVSGTQNYRDDMGGGQVRDGKNHIPMGERAICASSQDWAGWLAG
jgi:hypothetical protein